MKSFQSVVRTQGKILDSMVIRFDKLQEELVRLRMTPVLLPDNDLQSELTKLSPLLTLFAQTIRDLEALA